MKDILVPENWSEVTLEKFQEIQILDKSSEDYDTDCISILCDLDVAEVERMDIQTYSKILASLVWLIKLPTEANYKPIIKHKGQEYGIIKMSSLTNGQWYSLETWLEKPSENLHKILAMIYRPLVTAINDDYRILEDYKADDAAVRAESFKKLSVADCYGAILFFSIIEKECMRTMKDYLTLKIIMEKMPKIVRNWTTKKYLKKWSEEGILGFPFFTLWQKAILRKYQPS